MDSGAPIRIAALVERAAAQRPDHPALIYGERRWTYAQLRQEMERRATLLRAAGLAPGAVIGTTEPNSDDSLITFLAAARAGQPFLCLSQRLAAVELQTLLLRAEVRLLFTADGRPHPAAPEIETLPIALPGTADTAPPAGADLEDADALAVLHSSSGTTGGLPKLVRMPHRQLTWRHASLRWWETTDQVIYNTLSATFPLRGFCDALAGRMTFVQSSAPDIRQMEGEMVRHSATVLRTVPPLLHGLVSQPAPAPSALALAFVRTGAAFLTPDLARQAMARYGATTLQEYASTEGGALLGTPREATPAESIGKPYAGVQVRLVDLAGDDLPEGTVGELVFRSPGLSLGYLGDPEATARTLRDGWLWTGDLAQRDAAGFYYLAGRRSLRINVGGHMVSPEEVEAVLERHPAVKEVVVLGAVDARRGEVVRAVIVPRGKAPPIGDLQRFCRAYLAGHKVPRLWAFRAELPRSALGKVLRQHL